MKRKRWVAVFLSLVLILSMGSPVSVQGYSGNSSGSGEEYSMSQTDEKSSEDVQEISESEEVLEETTVKEETNSDETTVTESETVTEQTSEEGLKETVPDSEIVTDETSEDVENSVFPAQDFSGEANDVAVTVNAPEGAFPEGTTMSVTEADEESVQAAADAANASTSDVKAVEITFTSAGEEIEPAAAVKVTLKSNLLADVEEPIVVHVDDEKKAEVVTDVTKEEEAVSFEADVFSVYAVATAADDKKDDVNTDVLSNENQEADTDVAVNEDATGNTEAAENENINYIVSINYVFEDNTQAAQTWSASLAKDSTYSNTIAYPEIVGYAPEVPSVLPNGVSANENGITFNLTVQSDITINIIYKPAMVNYTVNYYQQNVNDDNYTLADTETKTGLTGDPIGVTYNSEKDKYEGFYGLLFDESATIAADGSTVVEIYYDRNYYLMSFDLDGGYGVEPIYARYGAEISVGDPEKPGHSFSGWDNNIPKTMPAANTTFTALWDAESVNYTVVFWYENANDDNYSYAGSITDDGIAGSTINSYDYRDANFNGRDSHFTYNNERTESQTVAGDGSTVLNVYFTRNEYTLTFRSQSNWGRYTTYGTITAKYQEDIADQWPTAGTTMTNGNPNNNRVPNNLYYWNFTRVVAGDTVAQATKVYTMTADMCSSNGVTLIAYTGSNLSRYTVNYYLESLDGSGTIHNGIRYNLSEEYSQILMYNRWTESWNAKMIDGYTAVYDSVDVGNNNTFNLYYTRNRHDITFYDNHGTTVADISNVMYEMPLSSVTYNDLAISNIVPDYPDDLEAGAYEFGGWYTTAGCYDGTEADFTNGTMPNANLAFYAKWVPVTHTVNTYFDSMMENQIDTQTVSHGSFAEEPAQPENGNYTFVGWFYMDNGIEKAFDFESMPVRKDLDIYAKWSSNVLVEYTINYQLENGTVIADPTTGSALAGTTRTFEAKTGDQLYADYQTGYFPIVSSHSLIMNIAGGESNIYTFVYREAQIVPYTVKYLDAETNEPIADDKVVSDNTYAVVTETAATVSGYLPDAFQKRLILTVPKTGEPTPEDNVLIFYYTEDNEHAIVSTTHYLVSGSVETQYQHSEEIGTIGQTYTREALEISEYELYRVTINGKEWNGTDDPSAVLTGDGLNFEFYYKIPYFYVYHSSDQSVETIDVPESGTYDLTKLVKSDYLYGGYYRDYKDAGNYNGGPDATYDGNNYMGGTDSWNASDAYTIKGTAMTPVGGQTYYLKEVPVTYLRPATYVVYDTIDSKKIKQLYLMTATDDQNYKAVGFETTLTGIVGKSSEKVAGSLYDQVTVNKEGQEGVYQTLSANTVFGLSGYLALSENKTDYIVTNASYLEMPYYVTYDGIKVTGNQKLKVYLRNATFNDWKLPGIIKSVQSATITATEE